MSFQGSFSQFTYKNVAPGSENAIKLDDFLDDAGKYLNDKKTPSGRSYSEIQATTFWRAASAIKNFGYQVALNAYSNIYGKDIVNVTESQAYDQTNDAVWYLMKTYGIRDNKNSSVPWNNSLEEQLYNTAVSGNTQVLRAAPTEKEIKVTGGNQFVYNDATKVWETGTLTLTAPVQHDFILSLPAGITTETGSTVIKTGESFVLKTNVKPAKNSTATISADLSWIDGGLKSYTPAGKAVASDGKGFQDMIGVLIKSTPVTSSFSSRKTILEVTTKTQINLMHRKMPKTPLPPRSPRPKTTIPAHRTIQQITIASQPTQ